MFVSFLGGHLNEAFSGVSFWSVCGVRVSYLQIKTTRRHFKRSANYGANYGTNTKSDSLATPTGYERNLFNSKYAYSYLRRCINMLDIHNIYTYKAYIVVYPCLGGGAAMAL